MLFFSGRLELSRVVHGGGQSRMASTIYNRRISKTLRQCRIKKIRTGHRPRTLTGSDRLKRVLCWGLSERLVVCLSPLEFLEPLVAFSGPVGTVCHLVELDQTLDPALQT